ENCCVADADGRVQLPPPVDLSSASVVGSGGLFLLDDSRSLYLYVGEEAQQSGKQDEIFELRKPSMGLATEVGKAPQQQSQLLRLSRRSNDPSHISTK